MTLFTAQTETTLWPDIIHALSSNGLWVFLGIVVIAETAKKVVKQVMKHRERIAMIENGMHPEAPVRSEETVPFDRETA